MQIGRPDACTTQRGGQRCRTIAVSCASLRYGRGGGPSVVGIRTTAPSSQYAPAMSGIGGAH